MSSKSQIVVSAFLKPGIYSICKLIPSLILFHSFGMAQISAVSLNLTNSFDKDANFNSNYRQSYQLMVMGKIFNDNFSDFVFTSSFKDQRALNTSATDEKSNPRLWNYSLRTNILKRSRFPLQLRMTRTRREANTNYAGITEGYYENNDFIDIHGSLPGNGILPKIVFGTSFSQISNQNAVTQQGRQFSLAMNNQSQDANAGYSMNYSKTSDLNLITNTTNSQESASFNSFTRVFDKVKITTQANLNDQNGTRTSNGIMNIIPDARQGTRHSTTLSFQRQTSTTFSTLSKNMNHSSSFIIPGGMRLVVGADLTETGSTIQNVYISEQNGSLRANFQFNKRIKKIRISGVFNDRSGIEKVKYHDSYHLNNLFSASGRLRWKVNNKLELRCEESLTHTLNYVSGSTIRNAINLGLQSNLSSNFFIDVYVIEGHSMDNLNEPNIIHSRTVRGRSNIKIGRTTVSSIESNISWNNVAEPYDRSWSSRITVSNSGLFRNVSAQLSGLYNSQTLAFGPDPIHPDELNRIESFTFNAKLSARIFAYRINVRYDYKWGKFYDDNRYFMTISRPVYFTF